MTIKVLEKTEGCFPEIFKKGDWFDLVTAEDVTLSGPLAVKPSKTKNESTGQINIQRGIMFDYKLIPLGVCMEIPEGYEALIAPRSSMFKDWGLIQTNSIGIIDNSYKGDNDEWKLPVFATKDVTVPKGTRLCQFRIQPNQRATKWQKIKWLFSSTITLKKVESLGNPDRKGFGEGTKTETSEK